MKRFLSLMLVFVFLFTVVTSAVPSAVTVNDLAKEFVTEAYEEATLQADKWYETGKGKLLYHMDFDADNSGNAVPASAFDNIIGAPSSNGKFVGNFGKVNPELADGTFNMSFRYVDAVSLGSEGINKFVSVSTMENTYVSFYLGNTFTETGKYTVDFKYKYVPDSSSTADFYYLERKTPAGDAISEMVTGEWTDVSLTYDVTAPSDIRLNFTTKGSTVYSTNDAFYIDDIKVYKYEEPKETPTVSTKWYNLEKGNLLFNAGFEKDNEGNTVVVGSYADMIGAPSSNGKLMSLFGEVNPYAPKSDYKMSFRYVDSVNVLSDGSIGVSTLENTYISFYLGNTFTEAGKYTVEFRYKFVPENESVFKYVEFKSPAMDATSDVVSGEWKEMSISYNVSSATDLRLNFSTNGKNYSTNDAFYFDDIKVYKSGEAFEGSLDEPEQPTEPENPEPEQPEEPEEPAVETVNVTVVGGVNTLAGDKVITVPKGSITAENLKALVVDHGDMILTGLSLTENDEMLSGTLELTEDMTVYAHWQKTGEILSEYSVEFEFDESSGNDIMWNYTGGNASTVTGHGYVRHKDGYGSITFNAANDHTGIWDSNIRVTNQAGKTIEKGKIKGIMIRMRYRNLPEFTCSCKTDKHNHTFKYNTRDVAYTNDRHMFQIYYLNDSASSLSEEQSLRLRYYVKDTERMNEEWFTLYFDVSENADFQEKDIAYLRYDFENGIWDNMIVDFDYIRLIGDVSHAPENVDVNEIKTTKPIGVRFKASLTKEIKDSATSYGWIFARSEALSGAGIKKSDFTYENSASKGVATLRGVNFGEGREEALIFDESGANIYYTALLYNIPKDEYEDKIVSRPFAVIGGVTYYGNVIEKSMYDVAKAIQNDGFRGLTAVQQSYVQRVIDYVEEN